MTDACYVYDPLGRVCTLDQGHAGDHVAHDIHGDVVVSWPNKGPLAEFLLARISEDEGTASLAAQLGHHWQPGGPGVWAEATTVLASGGALPRSGRSVGEVDDVAAPHVLAWSPARVLAECEAKRRIVELHRMGGEYTPGDDQRDGFRYCATCGSGEPYEYPTEWPCTTLRLLALPYADHPDYRQEWRP